MREGISVIDNDLKLVPWNKRYLNIFNYPDDFIYIGCSASQLIQFNLSQQSYFIRDIAQQVENRIQFIKTGSRHNSEYKLNKNKNTYT